MTPHSVYGSDVDQLYTLYAANAVRHYAMREPTRDGIPRPTPADRAFCRITRNTISFYMTNLQNNNQTPDRNDL